MRRSSTPSRTRLRTSSWMCPWSRVSKNFRIRCCFVEMVLGLGIPAIFPSNGSVIRRPLPSPGSLWVGSPASAVLRGAPILCCPSRLASLSFARRFHPRPSFAPLGGGRIAPRPGLFSGFPNQLWWRWQGLPGSWGPPLGHVPGSTTPVGLPRSASSAPRCCFPLCVRRQLPPLTFRGSIPQPASSLSTLRSLGYPRSTQDSLPAGGLLCRAGFEPAGVFTQASPGAHAGVRTDRHGL